MAVAVIGGQVERYALREIRKKLQSKHPPERLRIRLHVCQQPSPDNNNDLHQSSHNLLVCIAVFEYTRDCAADVALGFTKDTPLHYGSDLSTLCRWSVKREVTASQK
jgi:hypothetical protein